MATTLTSAELQRLRNMFEELDVDDSGDVSIAELRSVRPYLRYISAISPLYLPYISPISPLFDPNPSPSPSRSR